MPRTVSRIICAMCEFAEFKRNPDAKHIRKPKPLRKVTTTRGKVMYVCIQCFHDFKNEWEEG